MCLASFVLLSPGVVGRGQRLGTAAFVLTILFPGSVRLLMLTVPYFHAILSRLSLAERTLRDLWSVTVYTYMHRLTDVRSWPALWLLAASILHPV